MKYVSEFFYTRINKFTAIGITILTFAYIFLVLQPQTTCASDNLPEGLRLLGVSFGFEIDSVIELFTLMSPSAFDCYLDSLLVWDMIFPVLYTGMNIALISVLFRKTVEKHSRWWWLNIFPLLQMILDFGENILCGILVNQWVAIQEVSPFLVQLTSIITQSKWITSGIIYLLIFIGIFFSLSLIISRYKNKNSYT